MNWCVAEFNFEHEPSRSEVITHTAILSGNKNLNSVRMNKTLPSPLPLSLLPIHCGRRGSGSRYQLYETPMAQGTMGCPHIKIYGTSLKIVFKEPT